MPALSNDRIAERYAQALRDLSLRHDRLVQGLSILRQIDDIDDPALDLDTIFRCLLNTLSYGLQAENCSLMLLDESQQYLELRAASSPLERGSSVYRPGAWQGKHFRLGEGVVGRVASTGRPIRLLDAQNEENFIRVLGSPVEVRSLICYPLRIASNTIGVLNLSNPRPGVFTIETEGLLGLIARRVTRLLAMHLLYQKVRNSEEHYRLVSQNAGDGVLVSDGEGRILNANPAIKSITDVAPEAYIRGEVNWDEAIHPEDRAFFAKRRLLLVQTGEPCTIEYRVLDAGFRTHYIEERSSVLRGARGTSAEIVSVVRDVTERRRAEQALEAVSRMEATATLAGGIAHDFNNLMTAVLGNAEILSNVVLGNPEASEHLLRISEAAERAGELAQQMLAFARGGKYQPRVLNLNILFTETLRLFEQRLASDQVRIERDLEVDLWNTRADAVQMGQVLRHLCTNAVEAVADTGTVVVRTRNVDFSGGYPMEDFTTDHGEFRPGRYVCLSVEDTGGGMSATTLHRAFEPFFSTKFQGRGLGLASVYGIIKNHDGFVTVRSREGHGSAFFVYLLVCDEPAAPAAVAPQTIPTGHECVLVVDDEEIVLAVTREILEMLGYRVLMARDGQEAVDIANTFDGKIDVVLLDMGMPVLSGSHAFPLLRKARPDTRILICSGYELDTSAQAMLDGGASAFVQKPFSRATLAREIRAALDTPPRAAAGGPAGAATEMPAGGAPKTNPGGAPESAAKPPVEKPPQST